MAIPGPTDRVLVIDNAAGTPVTWTPLIVGEITGIGAFTENLTDLTGSAHTAPKFLPAGFTTTTDLVVNFAADVGGAAPADPTTEFWVTRTGSRTITYTHATGWTVTGESYIKSSIPKSPVGELSTLEVTFVWTGTVTPT